MWIILMVLVSLVPGYFHGLSVNVPLGLLSFTTSISVATSHLFSLFHNKYIYTYCVGT